MKMHRVTEALGFTFAVFSILFLLFLVLESILFCGEDSGKCFEGKGLLYGKQWDWNGDSSNWERLKLKYYFNFHVGAPTAGDQ